MIVASGDEAPSSRPGASPADAGPRRAVDAAIAVTTVDAGVPVVDAGVPTRATDAAVAVATPADAGPSPADQKRARAKELLAKARKLVADDQAAAIALADESLALRRSAEAYYVKADALRRKGDVGGALAAADAAIQLNSRYADAWKMTGQLLRDQGRHAEAREAFATYLSLRPSSSDATWMRKYIEGGQ